jgi:hypothetical protein
LASLVQAVHKPKKKCIQLSKQVAQCAWWVRNPGPGRRWRPTASAREGGRPNACYTTLLLRSSVHIALMHNFCHAASTTCIGLPCAPQTRCIMRQHPP